MLFTAQDFHVKHLVKVFLVIVMPCQCNRYIFEYIWPGANIGKPPKHKVILDIVMFAPKFKSSEIHVVI